MNETLKHGETPSPDMKTMLVTGAAGFIGSHLVDQLLERGYKVVGIDNMSTGTLDNLDRSLHNDRFTFFRMDIRRLDDLTKLMKDQSVRAVFHEAAIANVLRSIRDPCETNEVNVSGTINVLVASKSAEVGRVILASSGAVYGKPSYLPYDEEHPTNPISPYGASKRAAELYCLTFERAYGVETVVLRYFNVYGPRQRYSRESSVTAAFVNRSLRGRPLPIYGDGKQTRDFVYVADVVEANLRALQVKRAAGKIFNVGCGRPTPINRLASLVLEAAQRKNVPVVHKEPRPGEVKHGYADIGRARKVLKFEPAVALAEGIKRTVEAQVRGKGNR